MKMVQGRIIYVLAFVMAGLGLTAVSMSAALYTENFTNTTSGNQAISTVGWTGYYTTSATNVSAIVMGSGADTWGLSNTYGNPIANGQGYLFTLNSSYSQQIFAAYDSTFTAMDMTGTSITWNMGNASNIPKIYVLIQVAGSWYASTTSFSTPSGYSAGSFNSATSGVTYSLNFTTDKSAWRNFTLVENSSMGLGAALTSDLPSSSITSIGYFIDYTGVTGTGSAVRIDTLQIIPEPVVATLLLLGIGLVSGRQLRSRWRDPAPS
ncbi:MAG: hypothetical protein B9S32_13705 [Verrucomicrobia bacterium Tous-C9LFEB]|nr:MAG: hypothetical protein B9S32_13705 [Verrucomicrobia bacterium Tous-C9LFEB]